MVVKKFPKRPLAVILTLFVLSVPAAGDAGHAEPGKNAAGLRLDAEAARARVSAKERELAAIEGLSARLEPLLKETAKSLKAMVESDIPFLISERTGRIGKLEELLADPDAALGEKCRKTLEALQVEAEYGFTCETWREKILLDGEQVVADIFRLGRLGLYCLSPDGGRAGMYDKARKAWRKLPASRIRDIKIAAAIASRRQAPEIVTLPVGRPAGGSIRPKKAGFTDKSAPKSAGIENALIGPETTGAAAIELANVIRCNARDLDALIARNPQSARFGVDGSFLASVADGGMFPGMDEISAITACWMEVIKSSGETVLVKGTIVNRKGIEAEAVIVIAGPFSAACLSEGEAGFLDYSRENGFSALSRLPPRSIRRGIGKYIGGDSESLPVDISQGAALKRMTHVSTFWQQVPKGGAIGWVIVAVFAAGILMVVERAVFLYRRRIDGDAILSRIQELAAKGDWPGCEKACEAEAGKPLVRVIKAGLANLGLGRAEMENALNESILREIPDMERNLSTLSMLAAIAPLLGLLGTVTGMIGTFEVITLNGSADPRLMSSGISEALVTTMLGLIAAIPIMLCHTLLTRKVEEEIGLMEEKAMAMVNLAQSFGKGA